MRKSLGNKRNEISDAQIAEITRLYEAFEEGERVKIFPNHAFGYMRITVERPIRLASSDGQKQGLSAADVKKLIGSAERKPEAPPVTDKKGHPYPDPELRDNENVPLPAVQLTYEQDPSERLATLEYRTAVDDYVEAEVLPYVPDAWVDHAKTKIGYEIPLTRHFYKYVPPRPMEEIDAEIEALEAEIQSLLKQAAK
jgi:type I restriction enzyme M protein